MHTLAALPRHRCTFGMRSMQPTASRRPAQSESQSVWETRATTNKITGIILEKEISVNAISVNAIAIAVIQSSVVLVVKGLDAFFELGGFFPSC